MALKTDELKTDYLQLMTDMRTRTENSDGEFAERFAKMMEDFVKSGTPIYEEGLTADGQPVVGVFKGSIE